MNKRNTIILGLLFVIIVIEILVLAPKELGLSPSEEQETSGEMKPQEGASGQIMNDVHLVEAKPSGKEWELWADKAMRPAENAEWTIERVKVTFFASNGVTYQVTGMQGRVVPSKNDIRISGKVVTRSSNGYVFKTESMFYDSKSRKLTSPEAVEMTGGGDKEEGPLHLTGDNMVADLGTNEIVINKNVHARRRIKDDKIATIQSDRALFSGRSNLAHFSGSVLIDIDTMRLSGPEARFSFNPKTEEFESVEVEGGVKVTDTDKFATSSTVSVHFKEDRVEFTGAPRVVQNGDELVGDQIVFLEGGKKVQVLNAKAHIDAGAMEKRK